MSSNIYSDAKSRANRSITKLKSFAQASIDYNNDRTSSGKRAKIAKMLSELTPLRTAIEDDVQRMESAVNSNTAPAEISDNRESQDLISSFDSLYYELSAFADVHKFSTSPSLDTAASSFSTQSSSLHNLSAFQLPKRTFPTFSGVMTEWQGFEDLFKSILSHAPELPDVERFEYLKMSLKGEALSLVSHLALTATNYTSAWEILRFRYGNKRDLARVHIDALLAKHIVKSNDATSIQTQINTILENTAALDNLDFITRQWSPLLVHIVEKHLDYDLRARWELRVGDNYYPQISEFVDFLRSHVRSAEIYPSSSSFDRHDNVSRRSSKPSSFKPRSSSTVLATTSNSSPVKHCPLCDSLHSLRTCKLFTEKAPNDRFLIAKANRLCINCLGSGHSSVNCSSKYKCQTCKRSHHTLLHFDSTASSSIASGPSSSSPRATSIAANSTPVAGLPGTTSCLVQGQLQRIVLLSTALVAVYAADGRRHVLRALLDCGSQASFITENAVCALMLQRYHSPVSVSTFANSASTVVRGKCSVKITPSGQQSPSFCLEVSIVPQITGPTPQSPVTSGHWDHIHDLQLADPSYNIPGQIDLLLGADLLPSIYLDGTQKGQIGEPLAMNTVFGWVLMGPTDYCNRPSITTMCVDVSEPIDKIIKQFWELEELPTTYHLSPADVAAEKIYQSTTTRLSSGRFVVTLPFMKPHPLLGDSKTLALQRVKALECRLERNKELQKQYAEFMHDYLTAGHMEIIPPAEQSNPYNYYIPHHCVLKPDSLTTKLRVVFNASARTSAGLSLNESMYTGPKLQPDIQVVLLRARLWKYLFMADIKQMYRQILIRPADRDYLRILWRFSSTSPIDEYRLCTVTYGTSAAPFQALRTVRELATIDGANWPLAASVLLNDTFVDDILTGANTTAAALECQSQLINLCSMAQFQLRKWASNNRQILQTVAEDDRAISPSVLFDNNERSDLKVLGLKWDPLADTFSFKAKPSATQPTKRKVLSEIARIFDPLGLLSPITFWTKYLMQQLWTSGVSWDDPIPDNIGVAWSRYQSELYMIESIAIPRRLTHDGIKNVQLHAFSDSSEKGYAAAVYIRVETTMDIHCHLITGKSKVAPLRKSTIPRLELCGALLAARLLHLVKTTYAERLIVDEMHAWTDSTTALVWIQSSPHRWATFVANRTSRIQELTAPSIWHHVPTQDNPVDCASRGLFPSDLVDHPLWWTGPSFLKDSPEKWPPSPISQVNNPDNTAHPEEKKPTVLLVNVDPCFVTLLDRFSSLDKILRIVAYCLRIRYHSRPDTRTKIVHADELSRALHALIKYVQHCTFSDDLSRLNNGSSCSKTLRPLDPFVDECGLIRVGGRLENADIPYAHKHPMLLPARHRLTDLLIDHHHIRLRHPGASSLQATMQREFWILSARKSIRSRLRQCVPCFRTRPRPLQPKMASLPSYRVQQLKPFSSTGVDYAGPITLKGTRGRRGVSTLAYICLFVCTTTKAYHLELSSTLSTETFLLAFARFSSRRGPIKEMHSDCGTNFVGASKLLTPLSEFTHSSEFQSRVHDYLAAKQISWHFNPPSSPHFGGLWEAGVKSTKSLILRSVGNQRLTSEELTTLLTQIEATLNSRPLCPLSNDPTDLEALTPSHFLTLEPSTSLPDPNLDNIPLSKLQRWRLVADLHRHFWTRWKNEYLSSLQARSKWCNTSDQLREGCLVLIKEASHPLHWRLGRIRTVHPGSDGIARVATVDTTSGSLTRPAVKLCPLPTS